MTAIAIIGWGSLIWDLDDLAPKVRGGWALGAGPALPVEFGRVSPKRLDALALCICRDHGAPCRTAVIESVRLEVAEAAEDLRARERAASPAMIGFVDVVADEARAAHDDLAESVAAWCRATGRRGAVWTDLPPNFEERKGRPFSVEAALEHFRALEAIHPTGFAEGVRYMHRAPAETDTPLRRRVAEEPWWTAATEAHG